MEKIKILIEEKPTSNKALAQWHTHISTSERQTIKDCQKTL